ncbi:MAG TPA: hypothetical protein VFU76_09610 [Terriglobales bacterium]|nr:hypothetical protein [Terriglobales bacterium]
MKRLLPWIIGIATILLVIIGTLWPGSTGMAGTIYIHGAGAASFNSYGTPKAAVESLMSNIAKRNWKTAYDHLANNNQFDLQEFINDVTGTYGSLRTYSSLEPSPDDIRVLRSSGSDATVRANMKWATAVGAFFDTADLKLVKSGDEWKVNWPLRKEQPAPPQVIPVNYLRWDVIFRGSGDDWGAQNVQSPRVRIVDMNAVSRGDSTIILGEVVNEDTVPAFVSVGATLLGKDGKSLGQELSFDKMSHTLLPKEVSPFRIDFPGVKLSSVAKVQMKPDASLVPASADPVIGVLNQKIIVDGRGHHVLTGDLENQSGQVVNIPHVIATYYNNNGQVIWVADGYVDQALLPQTPLPFSVAVPDDLAAQVHNYRVVVNQYSSSKLGL